MKKDTRIYRCQRCSCCFDDNDVINLVKRKESKEYRMILCLTAREDRIVEAAECFLCPRCQYDLESWLAEDPGNIEPWMLEPFPEDRPE